jgi:hypothetical protein
LAKLYDQLEGANSFVSSATAQKAIDLHSAFSNSDRRFCFLKREGTANEEDAFVKLIIESAEAHKFGIPLEQVVIRKIYKSWRNGTVHMLVAKGSAISFAPAQDGSEDGVTFDQRNLWLRQEGPPAFEQVEGIWHCYVDILAINVGDIVGWLQDKVSGGEFDENLQTTYNWVADQLS